jgi:DNA-directed RNA polymerase alpha subunit
VPRVAESRHSQRKSAEHLDPAELHTRRVSSRTIEQGERAMPRKQFQWEKEQTTRTSDLVMRSCLPEWVIRVLRQSGVKRMSVIAALSDKQLMAIPGVGRRSITLIREELKRLSEAKGESPTRH